MRKMISLFIAGCLMAVAPSVMATSYSNTVDLLGTQLNGSGTFTWSHGVTPDFQIPFDTVNSARLSITSQRAVNNNDVVSVIDFGQLSALGANGNSQYTSTFNLTDFGLFSVSWASGQPLNLSLSYNTPGGKNDFLTMVSSTLSLDYTNNNPPAPPASAVPEPSTFLLLGAGLAGVSFLRRRSKQ